MAELLRAQPVANAQIICLSEHVDYWNRLGWTDPYSSSKFTTRQSEYAKAFHSENIYTPQMVVDGNSEFNGSDQARALKAIGQAAQIKKATLTVTRSTESTNDALKLKIELTDFQLSDAHQAAGLMLAVTEDQLHSNVKAGENAGRSLNHSAVTRQFEPIARLTSENQHRFSTTITVPLANQWRRENLRIVIFLQEETSRRILAAATLVV